MTIYELVQTGILIMIGLSIGAQLPHTSYIFLQASKLKDNWTRKAQAGAFCLIASFSIFLFIYIEILFLAGLAAFVEAIFNVYYYTVDFWQADDPWGQNKKPGRKKMIKKMWRQRWIYFFISVLIPAFMFIFGFLLKNLDSYL